MESIAVNITETQNSRRVLYLPAKISDICEIKTKLIVRFIIIHYLGCRAVECPSLKTTWTRIRRETSRRQSSYLLK